MRLRLEIRDEALAEAEDARHWYAERSADAADAFLVDLEDALDAILEAPERWPVYTSRTRRHLLRRFPYLVVYRLLHDRVVVMAIAHGRRRPGYWKKRLK